MKGKLTPKESFVLYGACIAVAFALFLLGLHWGKGHATGLTQEITTQPVAPAASSVPRTQVQTRLDLANRETPPVISDQSTPTPSSSPAAAPASQEARASVTSTEPAVPAPGKDPGSMSSPGKEAFSIQVGALKTEEEARKVIVRLESRGYTGILDKPTSEKDPFYRVRVGNYATREEALRAEELLKGEGFLTFVKKTK